MAKRDSEQNYEALQPLCVFGIEDPGEETEKEQNREKESCRESSREAKGTRGRQVDKCY